jgi:hypothetical protein
LVVGEVSNKAGLQCLKANGIDPGMVLIHVGRKHPGQVENLSLPVAIVADGKWAVAHGVDCEGLGDLSEGDAVGGDRKLCTPPQTMGCQCFQVKT